VLHALETGTPRLFVDNLNVLAQRYFFVPGQDQQQGGLDISFDLYGYLRPISPAALPASGAASTNRSARVPVARPPEVPDAD
jgi:general secretion pathway protein M